MDHTQACFSDKYKHMPFSWDSSSLQVLAVSPCAQLQHAIPADVSVTQAILTALSECTLN